MFTLGLGRVSPEGLTYTSELLVLQVEEQALPATRPSIATSNGYGLTGSSWAEPVTETDAALKLATSAAVDAVPFASFHVQRMAYKPLGLNLY